MELDVIPAEQAIETPEAQPQATPRPSYAPFLLALGIMMAFWGLATSPVMSAGGFVIFAWAMWTWIREISRDWSD